MYDVVIIGAGPAGLFAAYELNKQNKELKIALIDRGRFAKNRGCPMKKTGKCVNCQPCAILSGYGGAGTFSDGKLNFIPKLGKSDLFKYMTISEANQIIDDTEQIFNEFQMDAETYPTNMDEAKKIAGNIARLGGNLLIIKQKHLGSDHLPTHIQNFTDYLEKRGIDIIENFDVEDIKKVKNVYKVTNKNQKVEAKNVIVAPGRTGAKWVQKLADKYKIPYTSQSIEIGVRVEVRKEILEPITSIIYDPTIFLKTPTYGNEIRTLCTNPGGEVTKQNYNG